MCFGVPGVCSPGWFVGIFEKRFSVFTSADFAVFASPVGSENGGGGGFAVFVCWDLVMFFIRGTDIAKMTLTETNSKLAP